MCAISIQKEGYDEKNSIGDEYVVLESDDLGICDVALHGV